MKGYLKDRGDGILDRLPPVYKAEWEDGVLVRIIGAGKDIDAIMSVGGVYIEGNPDSDYKSDVFVSINGRRFGYDIPDDYTYNIQYINTINTWKGRTNWACVDGDDLLNVLYRNEDFPG